MTTLTNHEEVQETAGLQDSNEELFINGIIGYATRLGI